MKTSTVILALAGAALANPVAVPEKAERDLERRVFNLVPALPGGLTTLPIPQIPLVPGPGLPALPAADILPVITALVQSILFVTVNILNGLPLPGGLPGLNILGGITGGLPGSGITLPSVGSFPAVTGLVPVTPTIGAGAISPDDLLALVLALKNQFGNFTNLVNNLPKGTLLGGGGATVAQITTLTNAVNQAKAVVGQITAPVTGAIPAAGNIGGVLPTANLPGLDVVNNLLGSLIGAVLNLLGGLLGGGLLGSLGGLGGR